MKQEALFATNPSISASDGNRGAASAPLGINGGTLHTMIR